MECQTLNDMFDKTSSCFSEQTAVIFDDGTGRPESLSYGHLRALSAELCNILRESLPNKGVIGLYCHEHLLLPVWILGIMQTPAAYAPLDPADPGLLSSRVMERCGLIYCMVQTQLLEIFQKSLGEMLSLAVCVALPKFNITVVKVKSLHEAEADEQTEGMKRQTEYGATELKDTFAYVLHTSGTTGIPKIVKVPHKCIHPNICDLSLMFQIEKGDVVFLASPLTFDPSVVEMFMALTSGAKLLIVPALLKRMPKRLTQLLFKSHKTTIFQATPSLFSRFGPSILKEDVLSASSSLRILLLGGESCPTPKQLADWKHKDNKTDIYNIYGITEVSCWACCYRITERELQSRQTSPVPLGVQLSGTKVEVRDEHGVVIKEGDGQVFIGGEHRVCLLDDEDTLVSGTMRATGDWVKLKNGQMHFLGRRDRMIKRHGQRLSLDEVQQLILMVPLVEACAVDIYENHRLIAFIVMSKSEGSKVSPIVVCDATVKEEQEGGAGDMGRIILEELSQSLAHFSVPDTVVIVPEIPLTAHGKVDMKALIKTYQTHRSGLLGSSQRDFTKQTLESLWQNSLGLPKDVPINEDSNFLLSGGDSLKALVFHEDLLAITGLTSLNLLEIILDGTFKDLLHHISEVKLVSPLENNGHVKREATKRHLENLYEVMAKRERTSSEKIFKVIKRGSQIIVMSNTKSTAHLQTTEDVTLNNMGEFKTVSLKMHWLSDTGRCVDASPVILVQQMDTSTVFIGSHSHRIQALDLDSGNLVWERVLGDRIEASATVSSCGTLVIVGCYDGGVYFLNVSSGETEWVFKTGDTVKCCPAVDAETGLALVGSHDGHVYALDPKNHLCAWKHPCGGGAVFSSPFIHPSLRHLFVATLGGRLLCLNIDTAEELWSYSKDVPFFSSPVSSDTHVIIGSADGYICGFSLNGQLLWQFLTQAPVFSSPCLTPDLHQVLCGSHDGYMYCLNISDGALVWRFETSGRVYSSPFVFGASALRSGETLVGLASTDGTVWILDVKTGLKRASHTFPGELFSSPVVHKGSLVIGCRNDYVYCLKLEVT
ncbi:beta-alanine-activating enzyme isoform X1 [Periophthalmus magnuspinnatus]|nr:beta-alanine-activating enzyme isoform X1 [Periophthalmus magnuspinnatus]